MTRSTTDTVLVAASLLVQACVLSGCSLPFLDGGSSHSSRMSTTTTPTTTSSSSTSSTSSTTGSAECADDTVFKQGYRPQASRQEQEGIGDQGECCEACQRKRRCVVWSFQAFANKCFFVDKSSPFGGKSEDDVLIADAAYVMGVKRSGTCEGCWEHPEWGGGCGRKSQLDGGDVSAWKDCTKCDDPANWAEYPCFLTDGCACGGDQEWPLPSEGPSTGPTDAPEEADAGDAGWDSLVNHGPVTI